MEIMHAVQVSVRRTGLCALTLSLITLNAFANSLTLDEAIKRAVEFDPWVQGSQFRQQALADQRTAAGTWSDPKVSLTMANLPTDTFETNQEGMTHLKLGVAQMFPRGDSLAIKQQQLGYQGNQQTYLQLDRRAKVITTISQIWLDAYLAQATIDLIEQKRELFTHLVQVAQSNYSSALGKSRQQDVVRAQLELTRLEDRLAKLHEQLDRQKAELAPWLFQTDALQALTLSELQIDKQLPDLALNNHKSKSVISGADFSQSSFSNAELIAMLSKHPMVLSLDEKISASRSAIQLAKQSYKPQWGVNAAYGYRESDAMGNDRADLFSVGVTLDVPLFTGQRQDKTVSAAVNEVEAIKTEKWLMLRNMQSGFESARAKLNRLDQRQTLYKDTLLKQMRDQAEASLTSYTHDNGDFSELVRARIAELNAHIDAITIDVEKLKAVAQLNYFFASADVNADSKEF